MKWFKRILILLILLVVVIAVGVYVYIDALARRAIESGATYATGVETTVGRVHVGLFAGQLSLDDLRLANPEGFSADRFLHVGHGEAEVTLGSLRQDTVEVPYIRLNKIDVNLEQRGEQANYQPILDHLAKLSGKTESEGKEYVVREIQLTDITIHAEVEGQILPVKIDKIELANVGSQQSVDMEQLTGIIVKAIFDALMKHPEALPAVIAGRMQREVEKIGEIGAQTVEKIAEGVGEAIGGTVENVAGDAGKAVDDIAEGLGDLLKGNKK